MSKCSATCETEYFIYINIMELRARLAHLLWGAGIKDVKMYRTDKRMLM